MKADLNFIIFKDFHHLDLFKPRLRRFWSQKLLAGFWQENQTTSLLERGMP